MKILHLIIDHQVVERTMGIYEKVFPGCNEIIIVDIYQREPKHLKFLKNKKIINIGHGSLEGKTFDFSQFSHIVVHFMSMDAIDFIKHAPSNIHVCWEVYGWDLYDQFLSINGMKLTYTEKYIYSRYSYLHKLTPWLFKIYSYLRGNRYPFNYQKNSQFTYISNRVDSIQYCCKYDALYIEDYAKRKIPNYEIFNYSLTEVLGNLKDFPFFEANGIMVGNSASMSNNHMYVLEYLKQIELDQTSKIYMPLSYGGNQHYREDVEKVYKETFPHNDFVILKQYMPLHEYNLVFTNLNSIILSAWRQESQGTAIMGFYLGIKVFMSCKSPLYKWFKDCGFIVYTIEDANQKSFSTSLTLKEKQHNRDIVVKRYSDEAFVNTLQTHFL